ncbi:uncharacterized protein JN550_001675 [Neoarthrinium moseri]|uniref:uncharacterized protein n=1 Tax=Neoarthrinium moseri TaxID=1658444 RepID=UPI001FDBE5EE|nr:uncharacterized protein JN550_001675 [Neoarthrinium moseri]KAI1876179.1 hypothetical protein JN550_001675 [Neoarthrinium moseri]
MAAAGMVDPTKVGRYPVILSDALLGKKSSEVYTGVRYNHKPDTPPEHARLKPSASSRAFDLTYQEQGGNGAYKYRGSRTSDNGKYVLIFDPRREAFVLHKVDSTFNMNLTQTPDNKDAESLKREYPHLKNSGTESSTGKPKSNAKSQGAKESKTSRKKKEESPPAPVSKKRTPASDVEESSDDDGGLDIEFPGGDPSGANRDFSPAFPPRRFSEFVAQADGEDDDADGEDDDDDMSEEHFKLPSPLNYQATTTKAPEPINDIQNQTISLTFDDDSESEEDEEPQPPPQPQQEAEPAEELEQDDMDVDELEAELAAEFGAQSESDVSEED